jgi:hypothetical protein
MKTRFDEFLNENYPSPSEMEEMERQSYAEIEGTDGNIPEVEMKPLPLPEAKFVIMPDEKLNLNDDKMNLLNLFVSYAMDFLDVTEFIQIKLKYDRFAKSTAAYILGGAEIKIFCKGRILVDIFRSIAHELIHQKQFEQDRIHGIPQAIGGELEDEANAVAGQIVKSFAHKYDIDDIYEKNKI